MITFKRTMTIITTVAVLSGCQNNNISPPQLSSTANVPIKSQFDNNEYKYIELDNGLKVLLISDETTSKSAASLDVSVGAYHSEKGREGLYHFMEHMLFLGTKKYPVAGEYGQFLKKNGGMSNAYTAPESTNYFFDVKNDAFAEALDRFSQFFITPTFDPQFVNREKNAVQAEFSSKLNSDGRRISEAVRQTRNQQHPDSLFTVGDLDTLADRAGRTIHSDIVNGFKRHYSANRMSLVVYSNQPLSTLESWVDTRFKTVPNNQLPEPRLNNVLLTEDQKATRVNVVPLKEIRTLSLFFPITDTGQYFSSKPTALITHFLEHQGKHSLLENLKKRGWVTSINTRVEDYKAKDSLEVTFELSEEGLNNVDNITSQFFSYTRLISMRGVTRDYYDELKKISALDFRFEEKISAIRRASSLSPGVKLFKPKHLLNIYYAYDEFNESVTKNYLEQLNPSNMQQIVVAPNLPTTSKEKRYNVDYGITHISPTLINKWSQAKPSETALLPGKNTFIAQNVMLKSKTNKQELPKLVRTAPGFEMWHAQDNSFLLPKSYFRLNVNSPVAKDTPKNRVLLMLLTDIINDNLSAYSFDAELAGLSYRLSESDKGLELVVNGYNDKQTALIKVISEAIADVKFNLNTFESEKAQLAMALKNAEFSNPLRQAFGRMNKVFGEDPYLASTLKDALTAITYQDIKNYSTAYLSTLSVKALQHGNVTAGESEKLGAFLQQQFLIHKQPFHEKKIADDNSSFKKEKIVMLEANSNDSVILMTYPLERTIDNVANTLMLAQVLQGSFFTEIRTKQQLGYAVGVSPRDRNGIPAVTFYIQSAKYAPNELKRRIKRYLNEQYSLLQSMTTTEFKAHQAGLISSILKPHDNLGERAGDLWQQMEDGYINFDEREQLSALINVMTIDDLTKAFDQAMLSEQSRQVIVESIGNNHK